MSLFYYDSVKYVRIRDSRLAALRTLFAVVIAAYVVVVELFAYGGWLDSSPVRGVTRFSLQQPTAGGCDPAEDGCSNDFVPLDALPYCRQYRPNATTTSSSDDDDETEYSYRGNRYPCEYYEATGLQTATESSVVVATRGTRTDQELSACSRGGDDNGATNTTTAAPSCPRTYRDVSQPYKYYAAQTESFTVLLDHAVTQSKICASYATASSTSRRRRRQQGSDHHYACSAESRQHGPGRLYSTSDKLCKDQAEQNNAYRSSTGTATALSSSTDDGTAAPCFVGSNLTADGLDYFSLAALLEAAGDVHLDDCNVVEGGVGSTSPSNSSKCETYRETGLTVLLAIYWSDFEVWKGRVEPHYYYRAQVVSGSSYKQTIPYYERYRDTRTLVSEHGVKVAVLLGGEFSSFNLISFMITLTTALGLLAVATTVVDLLMLYILPERQRYSEAKFEQTKEFDDTTLNEAAAGVERMLLSGTGLDRLVTMPREVGDSSSGERRDFGEEAERPRSAAETISDEGSTGMSEPLLAEHRSNRK